MMPARFAADDAMLPPICRHAICRAMLYMLLDAMLLCCCALLHAGDALRASRCSIRYEDVAYTLLMICLYMAHCCRRLRMLTPPHTITLLP